MNVKNEILCFCGPDRKLDWQKDDPNLPTWLPRESGRLFSIFHGKKILQ